MLYGLKQYALASQLRSPDSAAMPPLLPPLFIPPERDVRRTKGYRRLAVQPSAAY